MAAKETEFVPPLEIGEPAIDPSSSEQMKAAVVDITSPLSSFHYQVKNVSF
jgi:betaine lipid synthase